MRIGRHDGVEPLSFGSGAGVSFAIEKDFQWVSARTTLGTEKPVARLYTRSPRHGRLIKAHVNEDGFPWF